MRIGNTVLVAGILTVVFFAFSMAFGARRTKRLSNGAWGGQHISIEVSNGSAHVEYDCANGEITGPLTIDGQGRFSWKGWFNREGPGPTRVGATSSRKAATYSGSITGDAMTLTVKLADGRPLDSFTLKRGAPGRVFKCK